MQKISFPLFLSDFQKYDWDSIMGALKIPRKQKRKNKDKSPTEKSDPVETLSIPSKVPKLMPKLLPKENDVTPLEPVKLEKETSPKSPQTSVTKISVITPNDSDAIRNDPETKKFSQITPPVSKSETKRKNFCNPGPSWIPGPKPKTQVKAFGRCMKVRNSKMF